MIIHFDLLFPSLLILIILIIISLFEIQIFFCFYYFLIFRMKFSFNKIKEKASSKLTKNSL